MGEPTGPMVFFLIIKRPWEANPMAFLFLLVKKGAKYGYI